MTAIIILLPMILLVQIYTFIIVKGAMEFMARKLVDNNAIFEKIIKILDMLSKN